MSSYVIRGARVLGAVPTDLLIEDGVLAEVQPASPAGLSRAGAQVVDADARDERGRHALPPRSR